jgi:acetyl esterase/lipase
MFPMRTSLFLLGFIVAIGSPVLSAADSGPKVQIIKDVSYQGDDRSERLDLYLPAKVAGKLRPAILIVHGGGWHGGDKAARREINIATSLARAGYVCASVNYVLAKNVPSRDSTHQSDPRRPEAAESARPILST